MTDSPEWEAIVQKANIKLRDCFVRMTAIWTDMGLPVETQSLYHSQVYDHLKDLLNDIVAESEEKKKVLVENVNRLMEDITNLGEELNQEIHMSGYDVLPLITLEQTLREDMESLLCLKEKRMMALEELLTREKEICKSLGIQPKEIDAKIPTEAELNDFETYLQKRETEKNCLENTFKEMRRSIIRIMDELGATPTSSFEILVCNKPENFIFSTENMVKLKDLWEDLELQSKEAKEQVEQLKQELTRLWKYLDEPEHLCQTFLNSYLGCSRATINALTAEVKRCKEKKMENIVKYVTELRNDLMNLWDLAKFGEPQKKQFTAFYSNIYTEDLLTLHELEIEKVRKFYESNKTIFDLLEEWENLWKKIKDLIHRANNPDRFQNRGGRLLLEEKERKAIQKQLPKIEEQLQCLANEYEQIHGEIFTVNGLPLEEVLAESWTNFNMEKETIKKARKEAKDKSVKKITLSTSKRTPTASISQRQTPLMVSKRKLFTSPANTSAKLRNTSNDKIRPTVQSSKVRRSGKLSRKIQSENKKPKANKSKQKSLINNTVDSSYNDFQEHLKDREELRSSLLPEHILMTSSKSLLRTPNGTPAKPLRKNICTTPNSNSKLMQSGRKILRSPRNAHTPKLAATPNVLHLIF